MRTHTFTLTVEQIVDDEHLDAIVDAVNDLAYVSNIRKDAGNISKVRQESV